MSSPAKEVKEGTAHLVPVRVLVDDGKLAKVAVIFRDTSPRSGVREVLRDLTGKEEIVISNQIEIADGQKVASQLTEF